MENSINNFIPLIVGFTGTPDIVPVNFVRDYSIIPMINSAFGFYPTMSVIPFDYRLNFEELRALYGMAQFHPVTLYPVESLRDFQTLQLPQVNISWPDATSTVANRYADLLSRLQAREELFIPASPLSLPFNLFEGGFYLRPFPWQHPQLLQAVYFPCNDNPNWVVTECFNIPKRQALEQLCNLAVNPVTLDTEVYQFYLKCYQDVCEYAEGLNIFGPNPFDGVSQTALTLWTTLLYFMYKNPQLYLDHIPMVITSYQGDMEGFPEVLNLIRIKARTGGAYGHLSVYPVQAHLIGQFQNFINYFINFESTSALGVYRKILEVSLVDDDTYTLSLEFAGFSALTINTWLDT